MGDIQRQLGEMLAISRDLPNQMREMREEARRREDATTSQAQRLEDRLNQEIRTTKEESRAHSAAVTSQIERLVTQIRVLDDQTKTLSTDIGSIKSNVTEARTEVSDLRVQVAPFNKIRTKLLGYLAFVVSVSYVVWVFIGPTVTSLIATFATHWVGKP
jgi:chromosome segregation ATPase